MSASYRLTSHSGLCCKAQEAFRNPNVARKALGYPPTHPVGFNRIPVLLRTETNEAFVVDEDAQRAARSDEHVDTQVALEPVD